MISFRLLTIRICSISRVTKRKEWKLEYQRDQENHKWILNHDWMARYYDAQYDVIEIDYDESKEFAYAPRTIPGCVSVTQEKLIASVKNKDESENH